MSKSQFLLKTLVKYATLQSTTSAYCECDRTMVVCCGFTSWCLPSCLLAVSSDAVVGENGELKLNASID